MFDSLAQLQAYASSTNDTSYVGQICFVVSDNKLYTIKQDRSLKEIIDTGVYQNDFIKNTSVYTSVQTNSADWGIDIDTGVRALTGNYSSVYTSVQTNSATTWNYQGTDLKNLSAGWVGGNSAFTTLNSNSANYILGGGNTKGSNLLIGTNDNFNLALETNNTPRLTVFSNGNIGINESSPEGILHVTAGSAGTVVAQTSSVGVFESGGHAYISLLSPNSNFAGIVMGGPTNSYGSYMSWNHDNLALKLATNHAGASIQIHTGTEQEALRITHTGNVGIGTSAPNEKLTVIGNISATGFLYVNNLSSQGTVFANTFRIGSSVTTATGPVGTVVRKIQVFDSTGTSLGFIPIYNSIT